MPLSSPLWVALAVAANGRLSEVPAVQVLLRHVALAAADPLRNVALPAAAAAAARAAAARASEAALLQARPP